MYFDVGRSERCSSADFLWIQSPESCTFCSEVSRWVAYLALHSTPAMAPVERRGIFFSRVSMTQDNERHFCLSVCLAGWLAGWLAVQCRYCMETILTRFHRSVEGCISKGQLEPRRRRVDAACAGVWHRNDGAWVAWEAWLHWWLAPRVRRRAVGSPEASTSPWRICCVWMGEWSSVNKCTFYFKFLAL